MTAQLVSGHTLLQLAIQLQAGEDRRAIADCGLRRAAKAAKRIKKRAARA
jgi:hypothetical protein